MITLCTMNLAVWCSFVLWIQQCNEVLCWEIVVLTKEREKRISSLYYKIEFAFNI